jgi:hypothetical protein
MDNLEKNKPTRTCDVLESKDILFVTFQQKKPSGQKPFMSRVGEVVITDG